MANEIQTRVQVTLNNGALLGNFNPPPKQITQSTKAKFEDVVTVGTSEQDLSLPTNSALTSSNQSLCQMVNLDSTNYVELGPKSGGAMVAWMRLYPGVPQTFELAPSVTLRWVANTASCKVHVQILAK